MNHQNDEKTNLEKDVKMMSKNLNVWLTIRNLNVNDYARIRKCERMQTLKRKKHALQFLFCSFFIYFLRFVSAFKGHPFQFLCKSAKKER